MNLTNLTEFLKAIARPAISVIFAIVIAKLVLTGIEAPAWFLSFAIPCITWWFIERTITHRNEGK